MIDFDDSSLSLPYIVVPLSGTRRATNKGGPRQQGTSAWACTRERFVGVLVVIVRCGPWVV